MSNKLVPYRINEKWGYCELITNNILIPVVYEYVYPFDSNGLGMVKLGGKWGLIDQEGENLTEIIYDEILDYAEGLYGFEINEKKGFIDMYGAVMISPLYDNIRQFKKGYAAIRIGSNWGVINMQGVLSIDPIYDDVVFDDIDQNFCSVLKDGKWGCVNSTGEIQIPLMYEYRVEFHNPHNIAAVAITDSSYFDSIFGEGYTILNDLVYNEVTEDFNPILGKDGKEYTYVDFRRIEKSKDYFTFINNNNEILSDVRYEEAYSFKLNDDFTAVKLDGKFGFIDTDFNIVIKPIFQMIQPFSEDLAPAKLNGKYGFIDRAGNVVIDFKYSEVINGFVNGVAQVTGLDRKTLYLNSAGQEFSLGLQAYEDSEFEKFDVINEVQPWFGEKILTCTYSWSDNFYFFKVSTEDIGGLRDPFCLDLYENGFVKFAFKISSEEIGEISNWCDGIALISHYSEVYANMEDYELIPFGYIDIKGNQYWEGYPLKRK